MNKRVTLNDEDMVLLEEMIKHELGEANIGSAYHPFRLASKQRLEQLRRKVTAASVAAEPPTPVDQESKEVRDNG